MTTIVLINKNSDIKQSKIKDLSRDILHTKCGFKNDNDLKKKAKKISELTKDVTEYLEESLDLKIKTNDEKKYKIAYHSACSMQHGQKVHLEPINLLEKTRNEILEIPEGHICCGSAKRSLVRTSLKKFLLK